MVCSERLSLVCFRIWIAVYDSWQDLNELDGLSNTCVTIRQSHFSRTFVPLWSKNIKAACKIYPCICFFKLYNSLWRKQIVIVSNYIELTLRPLHLLSNMGLRKKLHGSIVNQQPEFMERIHDGVFEYHPKPIDDVIKKINFNDLRKNGMYKYVLSNVLSNVYWINIIVAWWYISDTRKFSCYNPRWCLKI